KVLNKKRNNKVGSTGYTNSIGGISGKGVFSNVKNKFVYQPTATAQSSKNVNPCRVTNSNAGTNDHTCPSNIPTSNLYVALSQEFDSENYRRSGESVESEEEVKVVFDESTNLLKSTSTGASTNTTSDSFAILVLFYL
ncbi:hypothetical protein Tco_0081563, partial [Tanacetum coccineum]